MSMVVAHNMSAINTKRQFSSSARGMSGAMEKLSSGYKINAGKDDPSGLVISEKLRSQINGLQRAQQNTEEAINVMGIAEGALNEMNSILKKMKALAIHSNNTGVTSPEQIAADQAEMDSSIQTLDRIAQTTKFSNDNLLNGAKDIDFTTKTEVKGTQNNTLLNSRESTFSQIFKRDGYNVSFSFTGTTSADELTGVGEVDFNAQAMKAYMEVDTSRDKDNTAQVAGGKFTQDQSFTLTGNKGSRAFTFSQGQSVSEMVNQIKSAADSTGIDAALVFNSDQRVHMTTTGSTSGEIRAEPASFTINGINAVNAAGDTVAVGFELGVGMEDYFKANPTVTGLAFSVTQTDAGYTLSASTDGTNFVDLTRGWDGTSANLRGAITAQITFDDTNEELLTAVRNNMTMTGDINAGVSTLEPDATINFTPTNTGPQRVLTNIFGNIVAGSTNDNGSADLDMKVNWDEVYDRLDDTLKADFMADMRAGNIEVNVSITGATQAEMGFQLTINSTAPGSTNVYRTANIELSDANRADLLAGKSTNITMNDAVFKGSVLTINPPDDEGIGYDPDARIADQTNAAIAFDPAGFAATRTTKGITIANTNAPGLSFPGAAAAALALNATFTGLLDNGSAAVSLNVTSGGNTDALTHYAALDGENVSFGIQLTEGKAAGAETYNLTATVDGNTYIIRKDWDGATALNALTGAGIMANSDNASGALDAEVANALAELIYTPSAAIDFGTSSAAGAAFEDPYTFTTPRINFGAIPLGTAVYGAAGQGEYTARFQNFDMTALADASSDPAAFYASMAAQTVEVTASFTNVLDSDGKATGEFTISMNFYDNATNVSYALVNISSNDLNLDKNGQTDGWQAITSGPLAGMEIQALNGVTKPEFLNDATAPNVGGADFTQAPLTGAFVVTEQPAVSDASSPVRIMSRAAGSAISQAGGVSTDPNASAARGTGTVAIFNNETLKNAAGITTGEISKGVTGIEFSTVAGQGADSVQLGKNTDGQGRIYVKFLDDNSFELYKDSSLSKESLVASGINGQAINEANSSGLNGLTLNLTGSELTKQKGVYFTVAGIEGKSTTRDSDGNTFDGVTYTRDVAGPNGTSAIFQEDRTLITGVELGTNTDKDGKIYTQAIYDADSGTLKVSAFKDARMRAEDLVAESDTIDVRNGQSMSVVLNEKRNQDNTAGTGLGLVFSTDDLSNLTSQTKNTTFKGEITFNNLGARIFSQDYGSDAMVKVTQDKGSIFSYYGSAGQNTSKEMVDAGDRGTTVQINGQDATLSVNGMQVKTSGLSISMATQDIQANLTFNEGKVGSTTLAQVGYGAGSIFTKIGALNLGSVEAERTGKYAGLSGLLANAGHATNETVGDFKGGMQLQLGEGAGDQNRTVVAIKSLTSENLGRVTQGGYWDGDAVWSEKTFTMKDVMGGGTASLKQNPNLAMSIIDQAISDVSELRATIGAFQTNLLQTNSNNLSVTVENITKTESGIRDADMADEMAEFTKNQVLQSAAMSMMSQANQASQNVLTLLR